MHEFEDAFSKAVQFALLVLCFESYAVDVSNEESCPPQLFKKYVANVICDLEINYHCLEVYPAYVYNTTCKVPKRIAKGFYPVIDNTTLYIDKKPCGSDRYQPIASFSYEIRKCIFNKSPCNEEGQVVFSNGNTSDDATCRCDFNNNYAFISDNRKNNCSCKPSQEDCSCYRKICSNSTDVLSPDYTCVDKSQSDVYSCPVMSNNTNSKPVTIKTTGNNLHNVDMCNSNDSESTFRKDFIKHHRAIPSGILCILALLYMLSVVIFLSCLEQYDLQEYIPCFKKQTALSSPGSNEVQDTGKTTITLGNTVPDQEFFVPVQESGSQPESVDIVGETKIEKKTIYDGVIYCDMEKDRENAEEFKDHLTEIMKNTELKNLSFALQSEIQPVGTRIGSLNDLFGYSRYIMLFVTKNTEHSSFFKLCGETLLLESLRNDDKRSRIVPVSFNEFKYMPFVFQGLIPIRYDQYIEAKKKKKENKIYQNTLERMLKEGRKKYLTGT